jgi:hypothetical protein
MIERFHSVCDVCKKHSDEYTLWPHCAAKADALPQ